MSRLAKLAIATASACLAIPGFVVVCAMRKALEPVELPGDQYRIDARGIPTHACPACGHTFFRMVAHFEDYEVSFYGLDGECDNCGTKVTLPTLADAES